MTAPEEGTVKHGNYRWRICALLFVATTINYMDRSVIGILGPTLQYKVFHTAAAGSSDYSCAINSSARTPACFRIPRSVPIASSECRRTTQPVALSGPMPLSTT